MCAYVCVKCRDVCGCIAIWRNVPEADVDVERLGFARNRVAKAAEGTSSLAPPQGVAANGTEGVPSDSLAAPQEDRDRDVKFAIGRRRVVTADGHYKPTLESLQHYEVYF